MKRKKIYYRRPLWVEQGNWRPSSSQLLLRDCCAIAFGVDPEAVAGRSRAHRYSFARQVSVWALREAFPQLSFTMVGLIVGRDHSTVIHGVQRIAGMHAGDATFAAKIEALAEIGRALGRRTINGAEAKALAEFLCAEKSEVEPSTKVGKRQDAIVWAPAWSRSEDAELQAAIQADVDAEADALLARCRPSARGPGDFLDGERRMTEAEIVRRRAETKERHAKREAYHLERERARYGLRNRARAVSEMPA